MVRESVGQAAQGVDFGLHGTGGAVPSRQLGHEQVAGIGVGKAVCQKFELQNVEMVADDLAEQVAGFVGQLGVVGSRGHGQLADGFPIRLQGKGGGAEVVVGARLLRRSGRGVKGVPARPTQLPV